MKKFPVFLLCFISWNTALAQNHERIVVNARDTVSGYYLAVKPPAGNKISGVLVLLDGFGGRPESIFVESKLPEVAYANNILTIAVVMGEKIYADSAVISSLNSLLRDVMRRYNVRSDKFVIGGFSAGGTISLRYAELCKEFPSRYPIQPQGVFSIDGPVDLIDLWKVFKKQVAKNHSEIAANEARFVSAIMQREHGNPETNIKEYLWLTPFYNLQKGEGNEKYLKDIPVRVYHDVDIMWQLQNRRRSVHESNYLNSSELILRLLLLKNNAAEFIRGRTGYRSNGMRHPHSWNIVDEVECIQWMKKIFSK
jgi:hypothetical protein